MLSISRANTIIVNAGKCSTLKLLGDYVSLCGSSIRGRQDHNIPFFVAFITALPFCSSLRIGNDQQPNDQFITDFNSFGLFPVARAGAMGSIKYSLWSFHLFTTISSKNHFHLLRIEKVGLGLWCKPQATCAGQESLP